MFNHTKTFGALAAALVAAGAVTASVAPAGAASSEKVAFMAQMDIGGNGTLIQSRVPGCPTATVNSSDIVFFFKGNVGHFTGNHGFDCGGGNTFTLSFIAHHTGDSPTNVGTWKVIDGTGSFAGLAGGGTLSATGTAGTNSFVDYYTGTMTFP